MDRYERGYPVTAGKPWLTWEVGGPGRLGCACRQLLGKNQLIFLRAAALISTCSTAGLCRPCRSRPSDRAEDQNRETGNNCYKKNHSSFGQGCAGGCGLARGGLGCERAGLALGAVAKFEYQCRRGHGWFCGQGRRRQPRVRLPAQFPANRPSLRARSAGTVRLGDRRFRARSSAAAPTSVQVARRRSCRSIGGGFIAA